MVANLGWERTVLEGILDALKLADLESLYDNWVEVVLVWSCRSCAMLCELLMLAFGSRFPVRFKIAG